MWRQLLADLGSVASIVSLPAALASYGVFRLMTPSMWRKAGLLIFLVITFGAYFIDLIDRLGLLNPAAVTWYAFYGDLADGGSMKPHGETLILTDLGGDKVAGSAQDLLPSGGQKRKWELNGFEASSVMALAEVSRADGPTGGSPAYASAYYMERVDHKIFDDRGRIYVGVIVSQSNIAHEIVYTQCPLVMTTEEIDLKTAVERWPQLSKKDGCKPLPFGSVAR